MTIATITSEIPVILPAIIGITSLLAGSIAAYFIFFLVLKQKRENIIKEAEAEAEVIKRDKILQDRKSVV